ncbi:hypothetical protein [Fodinicola feengrottensis]|uniref:Secreted protein n=1 Tax=Fodinicola feengrottensis TaxID=435914 RepID=A0ABN2HLD3_9ACTN|nr:hypothetical protein [Fodinicola feengrottensis]
MMKARLNTAVVTVVGVAAVLTATVGPASPAVASSTDPGQPAGAVGNYLGNAYSASAGECKVWMNGTDWTNASGGHYQYTQAEFETWGHALCTVHYLRWHYLQGKWRKSFDISRTMEATDRYQTGFYWNGPGWRTQVCLVTGDRFCGDTYTG